MNRTILALSLVIPAGVVAAQEEPPTTQAAQPSPLTVETRDRYVAEFVHALLGATEPLPELAAGKCFRLSLDARRKVAHEAIPAPKDWVTIRMAPAALAHLYEAEIDKSWQVLSGAAIFALTATGMSAREAAKLMKKARSFPDQVASVEVRLSSNPEERLRGFTMRASIRGAAGSWLEKVTRSLRPLAQGAPALPVQDPLLFVAGAMDPAAYALLSEPMVYLFGSVGARNKKDRAARMEFLRSTIRCQDGSFAMVGDPFGGGLRTISGIKDPDALRTMLASDEYRRMTEAFGTLSASVEAEFEAVDFEHRGVPVSRLTMTIDVDTPLNPAGDQITFTAVAGSYLVSTTSLTKKDTKALIDRAMDQKVARAPIPAGALGIIRFKLVELMDKIVPFDNPLAGAADAPKIVQMTFDSRNQTLNFAIEFK